MTVKVFIATSVDGYIAKEDGNIDWLNAQCDPNEDYGYENFIRTIDCIIMGRKTFEKVMTFESWPYKIPVLALSKSKNENLIPTHLRDRVSLSAESPQNIIELLAQKSMTHLYIDGGNTIQSFMAEGLIDELIITQIPIILGQGIPLFQSTKYEYELRLKSSKSFACGLVQNHYQIKK